MSNCDRTSRFSAYSGWQLAFAGIAVAMLVSSPTIARKKPRAVQGATPAHAVTTAPAAAVPAATPPEAALPPTRAPAPAAPSAAATGLASANNALGEALMIRLKGKGGGSVLISPVSLSASLALLAQGAAAPTDAAFAKGLRLPSGMTIAALGPAYGALRDQLRSSNLRVEQANGLWGAPSLAFVPAFKDAASGSFGAQAEALDFAQPTAVAKINAFVAKHTVGKIPQAIQELPRDTQVVLVNALYFKGDWAQKFDRAKTAPRPFHRANGAPVDRPMMQATGSYRYLEGNDFQAVALPYVDPRFELVVMLPGVRAATPAGWVAALDSGNFLPRPGTLVLPRMKVAWSTDMLAPLRAEGFTEALGPRANYAKMTASKVVISQVVHSALLEVDEDGAEGGAATVVMGSRSAEPEAEPFTLTVDRPYYLLLREKLTGSALFMGYVADPGAQ